MRAKDSHFVIMISSHISYVNSTGIQTHDSDESYNRRLRQLCFLPIQSFLLICRRQLNAKETCVYIHVSIMVLVGEMIQRTGTAAFHAEGLGSIPSTPLSTEPN